MRRMLLITGALAVLAAAPVLAAERMPPLAPADMTPDQKALADQIMASRHTLGGPFSIWLRSPKLGERLQAVGEYVRFNAMPKPLRELAIMITSCEWGSQLEWNLHYREAINAGIRPEVLAAIAEHRRPEAMSDDEALVYDFSRALNLDRGRMSDAVFEGVRKRFGEANLVDLVSLEGYYGMVAMTANATQVPIPVNAAAPVLKPLS